MNVIVIGCGRLGAALAVRLFNQGHQVAVVDNVNAAFYNLPPEFAGRTVEGGALSQDVLHRAGIETADALAAVTNSDALNAVVGHIARTVYHISRVVVRNYDPIWRDLYETFGLQVVSSTSWGAQRMEEMLYDADIRSVFSAGNGEVDIYEIIIPETWNGCSLQAVMGANQCVPMSVTRAGRAILANCDMPLKTGDLVHFSATLEGMQSLREQLRAQKGA